MKFTIIRSKLLDGLQTVQNIVAGRSTMQILSNALIKGEDGKLWLTSTDLDLTVKCCIECEITVPGSTTLPVRRLASIVKELPDDRVTVEIDDDDVATVQCGSAFFKINGLSMRDFPPVPVADGEYSYRMDQTVLRDMLRKTSYAASLDQTRKALNGVMMVFKDGKVTVIATDGRRLALIENEGEFSTDAETEMILPLKTVTELMHLLGQGDLKIFAQKNQAVFDLGNRTLSTKLVDGVYPNYRQVIPASCNERVVVERELLMTAMRRISLIATEKANTSQLTFNDNHLTVSIYTDVGEARETLPIKYAGNQISVIFNAEYVIDPLKNLDSDEVYLEMNDGRSPVVFKSNIPFLYVLMPLLIK